MVFISHHVTPLVVYSLRGGHTYAHTHACMHARTHAHTHADNLHAINFKEPGVHRPSMHLII